MSTELFRNSEYALTRFNGGEEKGPCLQITPQEKEYITFSRVELRIFIERLEEILCKSL